MTQKYYLALFNLKSWHEFSFNGGRVYGTTLSKLNRSKIIHTGDYLLCYLTGISRFVGILEITSESYFDKKPLWSDAAFPVRFNVKTLINFDGYSGVSVRDIKDNLSIFSNLNNPKLWAGFFINSLNEFKHEDADFIVKELKKRAKK